MLQFYVIYIYIFNIFQRKRVREREREKEGGGGAKIYLYSNTYFIHQRGRYSAYTLTGRVNKPLDIC